MKYLLALWMTLSTDSIYSQPKTYTTPLSNAKGIEMFLNSDFRAAYWPLSEYYDSQINGTYCGIASAVMVLNALNIPKPSAWPNEPDVKLFTQDNFFSEAVLKVIHRDKVLKKGVTLNELAHAIRAWDVQVQLIYSNTLTEDGFRKLLKSYLARADRFIIANYYRPVLQGIYGGHFSPIAAYDQTTDSVLILDVYRYEFTPTWVELPKFFESLQIGIDTDSGVPRGLILVSASHGKSDP